MPFNPLRGLRTYLRNIPQPRLQRFSPLARHDEEAVAQSATATRSNAAKVENLANPKGYGQFRRDTASIPPWRIARVRLRRHSLSPPKFARIAAGAIFEIGSVLPYYFLFQLRKDRIRQVYLGIALRDFAMSLVGIFEPIYLYLFFRDGTELAPLPALSLYYALFFLIAAIACPLGAHLASRIGFRWVALLSIPFRFGYYVSLILLPHLPFLLFPALIFLAGAATLYWPGFHLFVAHSSKRETRATSVGLMNIAGFLASAAGPAIGGIIIMALGYPALFILVIIFLFASIVPFWFSTVIQERYSDSLVSALRSVFRRRTWRHALAFLGEGIEDQANGIVWPLFLFLITLNYSSLGFLISISLVITLAASYIVGKISDRVGWKRVMNIGIILHVFAWVSRIFVATPRAAFAAHSFYGFSNAVAMVPFSAIFYDNVANANGKSYCEVVFREQVLGLGKMLFLIGVAIFFLYSHNFHAIFLFAALATSCMWFLRAQNNA